MRTALVAVPHLKALASPIIVETGNAELTPMVYITLGFHRTMEPMCDYTRRSIYHCLVFDDD